MAALKWKVDKAFLFSVLILMVAGFFIFSSASLGLLARSGTQYSSVAFSQTVLGLFLGSLAMIFTSRLDYKVWKKYAFYLLIVGVILNILVLIPHIGFEHGGARRWFLIGGISFQPSEVLKLAFVVYFSAWAAGMKEKMKTFKYGFAPMLVLFALIGGLLLKQPDTDTFMMVIFSGISIFLAAGGRWKYVLLLGMVGVVGLAGLAFTRPYVMQRITTFIHPEANAQGSSYQIQQSLIAIGSGGVFGRGFGQSIQKFNFLPEPIGDSIFAVEAEEFGFVGASLLILLFVFFATRGIKIASRVSDPFGRLVVVGLVIMITAQAFVNIGAMLGVLPLSGITLPFVSHGGTSLFITLLEVGIILSVSKSQKLTR
ncbi:MAG: spoVE [Parcubacteria group bacterium]|nr:spoVE [Parcubacteria group bacterium]